MNAGAEARQKDRATTAIQKRIGTLNERHKNGEIGLDEVLDGLSLVVNKRKM